MAYAAEPLGQKRVWCLPGSRGSPAVSPDPVLAWAVQTSWYGPQAWATAVLGGESHSSASSP